MLTSFHERFLFRLLVGEGKYLTDLSQNEELIQSEMFYL